jgi:membrane associated rhomboid family serine protease
VGRPWATFGLATAVLLVGVLSLPEQLGPARGDLVGPPSWFQALFAAAAPLAALVSPFVPVSPLHALLGAIGVAVAGFLVEGRFGTRRTLALFGAGAMAPWVLMVLAWGFLAPPIGPSPGAMGLFGARLFDMARRGESRSLFGPLVGPIILHGAVERLIGGEWGVAHAAGFVVGALLGQLLGRLPSPEPTPEPEVASSGTAPTE